MPNTPQKKSPDILRRMFEGIDEVLAKAVLDEDFEEALREITETLKALETRLSQSIAQNKAISAEEAQSIRTLVEEIKSELSEALNGERGERATSLQSAIAQLKSEVNAVRAEIPELPDYSDIFEGLDGKLTKLETLVIGENVRNSLEALPEGEKLAIEAIEGLRKELDELKKVRTNGLSGGGGIVGRDIVTKYDLSPYLDGVTKTFNIPGTWAIISVSTSSFPGVLRPTIDYTNTDSTITFTSQIEASTTLAAGQTVILILVSA